MHEEVSRRIDKINCVQVLVRGFIIDMANRVNQLMTAEEIDIRLYAQDDIDRQQTTLYGINEEMGNQEIKS